MGRETDMVRVAVIARMDDSGLGHQTRDLVRALNPDKVIAIDFTFYNGFKQYPEWYKNYNTKYIEGFIQDKDVIEICQDVDIVLTAETFYNNNFIELAHHRGVETVCQVNYEFFEPLSNPRIFIPSRILMPSYWHLDDLKNLTKDGKTMYLPPPTFVEDFDEVRGVNYNRSGKKRLLHVAGKMAANDRAGTLDLLASLPHSKEDFELVIKVQVGNQLYCADPRVTFDYSFPEDEKELYRGFDAMVQPRRYGGLNLPMNEALSAGLPVIMTKVSPNNQVLPNGWLVDAEQRGSFMARTNIELFSANHALLGRKLDEFAKLDDDTIKQYKKQAHEIAVKEYSSETFKKNWALLLENLGV